MTTITPEVPRVEPELPGLSQRHFVEYSLPLVEEQVSEALQLVDQAPEDCRSDLLPHVAEALQRYDIVASLAGVSEESEEPLTITYARQATGQIEVELVERE